MVRMHATSVMLQQIKERSTFSFFDWSFKVYMCLSIAEVACILPCLLVEDSLDLVAEALPDRDDHFVLAALRQQRSVVLQNPENIVEQL